MKQRKMNLAAFVVAGPVSGHHGGWRYPTADRNLLSLEYYRNIGRILEDGRFDLIFFADILAIPNRYEGKLDSQLRYGALGSLRLDPLLVLSAMAASTKYLGLASTISTSHPAALADIPRPIAHPCADRHVPTRRRPATIASSRPPHGRNPTSGESPRCQRP